jgi:hypothetical protein
MATTTPNYGWTVPTSTDLVKDGATAIETLGDAIDASMNTALGTKKAGMVLLNTTSFSGVASQSINDVFSATYTNYVINAEIIGDTFRTINFRYRVSGADNSSAAYNYQNISGSGATISGSRSTNGTSTLFGYVDSNGRAGFNCNVFNPFAAQRSTYLLQSNLFSSTAIENFSVVTSFDATTSFTGFSLLPTAGNITGSIRVYGYNN